MKSRARLSPSSSGSLNPLAQKPSGNPYAHVEVEDDGAIHLSCGELPNWSQRARKNQPSPTSNSIQSGTASDITANLKFGYSKASIERSATTLLRKMWVEYGSDETSPHEIIDPKLAAEFLGVDLQEVDPLGIVVGVNGSSEIAGILDRATRSISISTRVPRNTWRFTAAHELGHWVLHDRQIQFHRDLPIDGEQRRSTDPIERQANWFAAALLMPSRVVKKEFERRFGSFVYSSDDMFWLQTANPGASDLSTQSKKGIALLLATSISFRGSYFTSLAEQFHVSPSAMAYRIMELGLLTQTS